MKQPYISMCFADFVAAHATQEACLAALTARRWPNGFICPHCRHAVGYALGGRRGYECAGCHRQTGVTSGTTLAYTKLPLPKVFIAMYLIAANKQGISATSLALHIGCSEPTAWHLLHKLRHAMLERDEAYRLSGLIEVDESYVGGLASGTTQGARSTIKKTPVIAMVESRGDNLTGFVYLRPVRSVGSKVLHAVVANRAEVASTIRTDGWAGYNGLDRLGFNHHAEISRGRHRAIAQFKLVHRQFSNLKSWLLGTHRNTCRRHLDLYTAEFSWRTNRRDRYADGKSDHRESTAADRILSTIVAGSHWTWTAIRKHRWKRDPLPCSTKVA